MIKMSYVKRSIITAVCIALCVVLPMAFHSVRNAGAVFLPMHIPVLLCGLMCGGPLGLLCGLAGPVLSSLMTGMPPMAILPGMTVELAVYGLMTGLLMQVIHTKNTYADLYLSLIGALITGRVAAGHVSMGLIDENELALLFQPYFSVDVVVSNDDMYVVSGLKK